MAPSAGDVHGDLHHELRVYGRDVQDVAAAPPGGERAASPRVSGCRRCQSVGERVRHGAGERGGPTGVTQHAEGPLRPSSSVLGVVTGSVMASAVVVRDVCPDEVGAGGGQQVSVDYLTSDPVGIAHFAASAPSRSLH